MHLLASFLAGVEQTVSGAKTLAAEGMVGREQVAADDAHQFHKVVHIFFRKGQSRFSQFNHRQISGTDGVTHRRRLEGKVLVGHETDAAIVVGDGDDAYLKHRVLGIAHFVFSL